MEGKMYKQKLHAFARTHIGALLPFCYESAINGESVLVLDKNQYVKSEQDAKDLACVMNSYGWDYSNYDNHTVYIRRVDDTCFYGLMTISPMHILSEFSVPSNHT